MKQTQTTLAVLGLIACSLFSCSGPEESNQKTESAVQANAPGQSAVKDDLSQKNVVQVAIGSKDHSTLVTAIQKAELVDALSNAGPFTVFAPTNEAFSKLPAGTLDDLLKPEKKADLQNILQYHVSVGVFKTENMQDGQSIGQVNGDNITLSVKEGKIMVNGKAHVVASVPASNGVIYVIDEVLLPPTKK